MCNKRIYFNVNFSKRLWCRWLPELEKEKMQREILIIDDHDDLASALKEAFEKSGHHVKTLESRAEALCLDNIEDFDLVITDLDGESLICEPSQNGDSPRCLPNIYSINPDEQIKAFTITFKLVIF